MIPQLTNVSRAAPTPLPPVGVTVRPGLSEDVPFLDALQKQHAKQVGWMPTATLTEKVRLGHVLVAEEQSAECSVLSAVCKDSRAPGPASAASTSQHSVLSTQHFPLPLGYCIAADRYFKRDDVGIVYQMNVVPGRQRGHVGAALLKAQFERSAYGCRLYCCWCAQDLAANRFWEAMGFVPLAFRAGSEARGRVHIFWQKRVRQGDVTTPWWFPSKTDGGSLRAGRIVLPIPPETHWADAKPLILPAAPTPLVGPVPEPVALPAPGRTPAAKRAAATTARTPAAVVPPAPVRRNGLMFDIPQPGEPLPEEAAAKPAAGPKPKPRRAKPACDPRLASAARELRDRWLERVNADPAAVAPCGKYDVSRTVAGPTTDAAAAAVPLLTAAPWSAAA